LLVGDQDFLAGRGRRRARRLPAAAALVLLGGGVLPSGALAARVTIGTPTSSFGTGMSLSSCSSCTQFQLTAPDSPLSVPAAGHITAWHVAGAGPLALRVLRPSPAGLVPVVTSHGTAGGVSTFAVDIPVLPGDQIGVDLLPTAPPAKVAQIRFSPSSTATIAQAQPAAPDGAPVTPGSSTSGALSLNADVDLAPVAVGVDVGSGPLAGGTAVTITGSYLDGATQVLFGGAPATFTLGAAGELLTRTPARPAPGQVDVLVRGPGGTSTLAGAFTYLAPPAGAGRPSSTPAVQPPATVPGPAPVIRNLSLSPGAFLPDRTASSVGATTGTHVTYAITVAATTRFDVLRIAPGRLVPGAGGQGHYCQPALRPVPPAARCSRYVALRPFFTHQDRPGVNRLRFPGRLGGHALPPGPYRLTATAADAGGNHSPPVTHAFRILAPPARR
jgi:hypothetical protein